MAKNDFQYGGWNSYTLQCGTIMTLISPGDCTLQCGMWLWNRDSEFTKWQHPAMWYVALEWHAIEFARWQHRAMWQVASDLRVTLSWHRIRQVAAPCNVAGGSGMACHWIRPKRPLYWNSTSGFDFDQITTVDMSFCTSLRNFIEIGPPSAEKMTSYRFSRWRISAAAFLSVVNRQHSSKLLSFSENRVFCILALWRSATRRWILLTYARRFLLWAYFTYLLWCLLSLLISRVME